MILLGAFFFVFYPSLQAKILMRWDVFIDILNKDHDCSKNDKSVQQFLSFLVVGGVISILSGILLLGAPIITATIIGWKLFVNVYLYLYIVYIWMLISLYI
jgi:hypothetical protein